jgi:hypothetical protein
MDGGCGLLTQSGDLWEGLHCVALHQSIGSEFVGRDYTHSQSVELVVGRRLHLPLSSQWSGWDFPLFVAEVGQFVGDYTHAHQVR